MEKVYRQTSAQMVRDILEDGTITTAEGSESDQAYAQCLTNLGLEEVNVNEDGSYSYAVLPAHGAPDPETEEKFIQPCRCSTGWDDISSLRNQMRTNPENVDSVQLMVSCLVRVGLLTPGYTAQQYLADLNAGVFDNLDAVDSAKFMACNADPAHAK